MLVQALQLSITSRRKPIQIRLRCTSYAITEASRERITNSEDASVLTPDTILHRDRILSSSGRQLQYTFEPFGKRTPLHPSSQRRR